MAVAFDAVGPSSAGATSASNTVLSWTHTNVGSGVALVVAVAVGIASDAGVTITCKLDPAGANTTMTALGPIVHSGAGTAGFVALFGLLNVSSGAHTITATVAGGTPAQMEGGSTSFTGALGFGAQQSAAAQGVTNPTITHTGSISGNMITAGCAFGQPLNSVSAGTSRWIRNVGTSNAAGNGGQADKAAGGSQAITWAGSASDWFAIAAVEVLAAAAVTLTAGTPFQATASVTTGTVTLPAGLAAGDFTFLFCSLNATTGVITGPAGWSTAFASAQSTASTSHAMAIYYRAWQSGDANPAVTCTSGRLAVLPVKVSGADPTTPIEGTVGSTTQAAATTAVDAPSQTPTLSQLLVTVHAGRSATNGVFITWTPPTGMTEVGEAGAQAAAATNASIEVASLIISAGATGSKTATASATATGSRGVSMLLAPVPTASASLMPIIVQPPRRA